MQLMPNQKVPELSLYTTGGGLFELSKASPRSFTLLVFYRGLHCPICKDYLRDLDKRLSDFFEKGVSAVAVSCDPEDRAAQSAKDWGLSERLPLAYGLSIDQGRQWGLYVSKTIKDTELPIFVEPGLFLVRPDGTLYASSVQTMPFARPHFDDVLMAISYVTKNNYPARGDA